MKHFIASILTSLLLAVMLFGGMAHAQYAHQIIKVTVPFPFNVNSRSFPAGNYVLVISANQALELRDSRYHVLTTVLTIPVQAAQAVGAPKLQFDNSGGLYALTRVWQPGGREGYELPHAKPAIKLAANQPLAADPAVETSQP